MGRNNKCKWRLEEKQTTLGTIIIQADRCKHFLTFLLVKEGAGYTCGQHTVWALFYTLICTHKTYSHSRQTDKTVFHTWLCKWADPCGWPLWMTLFVCLLYLWSTKVSTQLQLCEGEMWTKLTALPVRCKEANNSSWRIFTSLVLWRCTLRQHGLVTKVIFVPEQVDSVRLLTFS